MKLKQRVEILEGLVMPTLKDFFIELEKVDPELCAAVKTKLRQDLNSPDQEEDIKPSKELRTSFMTRANAVMRKQGNAETALPIPEFRHRLAAAISDISGVNRSVS
jgi:hypothetical protein